MKLFLKPSKAALLLLLMNLCVSISSENAFALTRTIHFVGMASMAIRNIYDASLIPKTSTENVHLNCDVNIVNTSSVAMDVTTVSIDFLAVKSPVINGGGSYTLSSMTTNAYDTSTAPPWTTVTRASIYKTGDMTLAPSAVTFPQTLQSWDSASRDTMRISGFVQFPLRSTMSAASGQNEPIMCKGSITVKETTNGTLGSLIASGVIEYVAGVSETEWDREKMHGVSCPGGRYGGSTTSHISAASAITYPTLDLINKLFYTGIDGVTDTGTGIGASAGDNYYTAGCAPARWVSLPKRNSSCGNTNMYNVDGQPAFDWYGAGMMSVDNVSPAITSTTQGRNATYCMYATYGWMYGHGAVFDTSTSYMPQNTFTGGYGATSTVTGNKVADGPEFARIGFPQQISNSPFQVNGGKPF